MTKWNHFICPVDGQPISQQTNSLRCEKGHTYDLAREGYCNLLLAHQKASHSPGDSPEMVMARRRFLEAGFYAPIAKKVNEQSGALVDSRTNHTQAFSVLDAGSGEGYYLRQLQRQHPDFQLIGIDISKHAVKAAAKMSPGISWAVASNKQLPVADGSLDLVLCMFGFPVWTNFHQVLIPNGHVLLVDAAEDHLIELREIIYPTVSKSGPPSIESALKSNFRLINEESLRFKIELQSKDAIHDLLAMTPHAYRMPDAGKARLAEVQKLQITVDLNFRTLAKRT
jgi:23S rRNA (guanine745-N1)-methyltransferase